MTGVVTEFVKTCEFPQFGYISNQFLDISLILAWSNHNYEPSRNQIKRDSMHLEKSTLKDILISKQAKDCIKE